MTQDRPLIGIGFMLAFCLLAPLGDALAKLLGQYITVLEILWIRFAVQAVILIPLCLLCDISLRSDRKVFSLIVVRTVLHGIGIGAMFTSLLYLPLADAIAIAFVMPFIMLLLGKLVLNEQVGPHRLIACAVGFIGVLLVIQPNFTAVGAPALLPLLVAVVFALFMLITRMIAKDTHPISLQAVSGGIALVLFTPLFLIWPVSEQTAFVTVALFDQPIWMFMLITGVLGTLAHLCMTASLRYAPSATLAPMQYLEIPFATLIGLWMFKELPNGLALIGIAVIIIAGLYVIYRERANAQAFHSTPS